MRLYNLVCILALYTFPLFTHAQTKDQPKPNWQNLDLKTDNVFGISTERAYKELLKGKTAVPIIVAVIDGGIDESHEDLKEVIWKNPKEIAGNSKDDDNNGYIDDIYGWNFIGSDKGNVRYDNLEVVRLIRKYQKKYAAVLNSSPLSDKDRKEFNLYKKLVTEYMDKLQNAHNGYESLVIIDRTIDSIENRIGKKQINSDDIQKYDPKNDIESKVLKVIKGELKKESDYSKVKSDLKDAFKYYNNQVKYHLNIDFDPRDSVRDNYSNSKERIYGNNDVTGPDALHGTHVSGIIGALRSNSIGIRGVADNIKIMAIRTVPDGDERDKDVANAIRYAVDNGAKVINMSFGKAYSWDKSIVDSAVKYALSKDVLLVHAAGNDAKNTEIENNFPNKIYGDSTDVNFWNLEREMDLQRQIQQKEMNGLSRNGVEIQKNPIKLKIDTVKVIRPQATNWIEVGASTWENDENLVAEFSNYGKTTVDLFAPGVKINSTIPESKYKEEEGTSMASPVVAGAAALLRSYYPKLTAVQIKDIIMNSVTKVEQKVKVKENGNTKRLPFKDVCVSGGIVNVYNAILLAQKTPILTTAAKQN